MPDGMSNVLFQDTSIMKRNSGALQSREIVRAIALAELQPPPWW